MRLFRNPYITVYLLVVTFWFLTTLHLDRAPELNPDEVWILSPGYKLAAKGVYGSDLFAGLGGMDQHYFEFMPLFPILQGLGAGFYGVGQFTMRFLPAAIGTLIAAIAFRLARTLFAPMTGALALVLLLFWLWGPAREYSFDTGIPLLDASRIARYDNLSALLGLCSLLVFSYSTDRNTRLGFFLAGVLAGLSGLAHLYGLFWVVLLVGALALTRLIYHRPIRVLRDSMLVCIGAISAWLPWLTFIAINWADYLFQAQINSGSFEFWRLDFYLTNLQNESFRYLGADPAIGATGLFGILSLITFAAAAWTALAISSWRAQDERPLPLLLAAIGLPLFFALFVTRKFPYYLVNFAPLVAVLVAWGFWRLWQQPRRVTRLAVVIGILILVSMGTFNILRMHRNVEAREPYDPFLRKLASAIPPTGRIIAPLEFWLAGPDRDTRSYILINYLTGTRLRDPRLSVKQAMEETSPNVVILDELWERHYSEDDGQSTSVQGSDFWTFMEQNDAMLYATLTDPNGEQIKIFLLTIK